MTSKTSGSAALHAAGGHSVVPWSSVVIAAAGAVCVGGEGEAVFSRCSLACRDHIALFRCR